MSFTVFQRMVRSIAKKQGAVSDGKEIDPVFENENGKFIARCAGITYTGCMGSCRLTAMWGSGHMAQVPQEACYA